MAALSARGRWHTALAVVSLLVIGAAVGVTADRLLHRRPAVHGGITRAQMHADPMSVIDRELNLRPDQHAQVEAIIEARQGSIDHIWIEMHNTLRATVDSVVAEILPLLDADQAARFHALVEELHPTGGDPDAR
jgi:Spy/CpxP family protein refolding chaperone